MNKILQLDEDAKKSFSKAIQPGRMTGIWYFFAGLNAAATTSTVANLGDVVIKRNGRTLVNRSVASLALIQDMNFGGVQTISDEAGEFFLGLFIPFYIIGLEQSLNITDGRELVCGYNPKTADLANFTSLGVVVKSEEGYKTIPERYEPYILGDDIGAVGAGLKPYPLDDDHLAAVYLEDPDDIVSGVSFKNNNGQVQSLQTWNQLISSTLRDNNLEVDTFTMGEIQLYSQGEASSYLNRQNVLEVQTSGAGDVLVTKQFIIPNDGFASLLNGQGRNK